MPLQPYFDIAFTPSIEALQREKGTRQLNAANADRTVTPAQLSHREIEHLAARDSVYLATVSETGWPYVQHRGGNPGFITVLGPTTIGWLERPGNQQYLGTGNLTTDDRLALIAVDYPARTRLKLFGRGRYVTDLATEPELADALGAADLRNDGAIVVDVEAVAWNCPKHLTPRFTQVEVQAAFDEHTTELRARIAELEEEVRSLRG